MGDQGTQTAGEEEKVPAGRRRTRGRTAKNTHNKQVGNVGEDVAARYLVSKGYEIIARNWTCPVGEADIVARDENMLVFVEVKSRTSTQKGQPSEAVDKRKRSKYISIAEAFCQRYEAEDIVVRFDVIALLFANDSKAMIRHYINAFGAE